VLCFAAEAVSVLQCRPAV